MSGCNKSATSSRLGMFVFIHGITCFGLIKWFKIDMMNNNNDRLWEGRARGPEINLVERTFPDPLVSDGHLQQLYEPRINDENQLSYLQPPTRHISTNIVPQRNEFPYLSSVSSNYPPESQVLPSNIVHQNERTKHQPHIVAPQHEVSVPLMPPHYSHSKRYHPYHSSFLHQKSSLIHQSSQNTRLHHDELGLSFFKVNPSLLMIKTQLHIPSSIPHLYNSPIRSNESDHSSCFQKTR